MGQISPEEDIYKEKVMKEAKSDAFRGQYLPFGGVHYWSMSFGVLAGAFGMYVFIKMLASC
ncbi:hypothetical protein [Pseudomonas viridiflava]|uniref:hypothetical protein n=1 Tax=Pseudomonas viridiflava TaxID=33069 RepID=UPI000F0688BB|nr:hypothetical protein [Pseudomonas viridiflava]